MYSRTEVCRFTLEEVVVCRFPEKLRMLFQRGISVE